MHQSGKFDFFAEKEGREERGIGEEGSSRGWRRGGREQQGLP